MRTIAIIAFLATFATLQAQSHIDGAIITDTPTHNAWPTKLPETFQDEKGNFHVPSPCDTINPENVGKKCYFYDQKSKDWLEFNCECTEPWRFYYPPKQIDFIQPVFTVKKYKGA